MAERTVDFNTFRDIIRGIESPPDNPFIRTMVRPEAGSAAFGPYQTNVARNRSILDSEELDLTDEERRAVELVLERQGLALKYGGEDRFKYEDPNSPEYKSKEFLDRYDYGGDLGIEDPAILSAYQSAQEKELERHFNQYGGDFLEAASSWHGGPDWRNGDYLAETENYRVKALELLDRYQQGQLASAEVPSFATRQPDLGRYSKDYSIQLPDGSIIDVPGGVSLEEADRLAKAQFPERFGIYPEAEPEPKEAGFFSSMYSGLMRAAEELPGGVQAIYGGAAGDSEIFEAAKARVKQADERAAERQGVAVTLDDVSKAYDEDGVISAAAKYLEMTTETIGQSVGYMAPSLVGGFLLGRVGTVAGAMLAGPVGAAAGAGVGTLLGRGLSAISTADKASKLYKAAAIGNAVGRTVGFNGTLTTNFLASNLSAAADAAKERGEELTEEDYDVLGQLAIAEGQSALESIMVLLAGGSIALGTGAKALSRAPVGGAAGLSSAGKRVLMSSVGDAIDYIDNLTPLKRFAATMAEEEVAEVGQQALERLSSGKTVSPLDEEAATEYLQIALTSLGPSLFFGGVGGAAAKYQERKETRAAEAIEQAKADMQAAALRQAKLAEEQEALALEQEAVETRAQFLERVLPVLEGGRTAEDVRIAADSRNINARDIGFSSFVRRITGKSRIEDLNQQEMEKLYRTIESMPVQEVPISFAIASKSDALRLAKSILDSGKKVPTDKVVLDALEDANLLGVDKRYVTEQELSEIAASFRARLNELGLLAPQKGSSGQGIGLKVDVEKYEKLSKLAELAEQNPEVDVVVPQKDYDAVLKYARLENNGYYPDLEAFKRITGFRNDSYYQLALDEAIARGDIAADGSNRVVQTRTPAARKKKFALEVKRGGRVQQLGVYETQKEADAARKALLDEANEARRIGRGPAGIPELSIKEIGSVIAPNVAARVETPYGPARKPEPELVQDYEFDVVERDEYVVRTRDGGIISHHKTAAEARRQIKKIKDKDNADNRERRKNKQPPKPDGERVSSIPTKETVYNVMQSEVGFETGKKTRGRVVVGSDFPGGGFLTREEAEAKAQYLRDRSSGAKSSFGRQADGNQDRETRLGVDLNLTPEELKELRADPVAFAEKKFPVSERTQGVQQGAETARDNLKAGVDKYLRDRGLSALKVEIVDVIEGDRDAQYDPVSGLFQIAMSSMPEGASVDEQVKVANSLMDHEIVHFALRTGLISRGEFNVLRRAASRTPIKSNIARERGLPTGTTYLQLAQDLYGEQGQREGWIPDDYVEEAIAFMAQDFSRDRKNITGKPASLFSRVGKAMGSLANVGRGAGFRTSEEIMDTLFGSTFGERYAKDVVKDSYYKNRRHQEEYKQIVNQIFQAAYLDGSLQPRTVYELETTGVISPSMALPLTTTRGTSRAALHPKLAKLLLNIDRDDTFFYGAKDFVNADGSYKDGSLDDAFFFRKVDYAGFEPIKESESGTFGSGIYFLPKVKDAVLSSDKDSQVYLFNFDIKKPLLVFTDMNSDDPAIEALVALGMSKDEATDIVDKDYKKHGELRGGLKRRARKEGYDSIVKFEDGEISELVLLIKKPVISYTDITNILDEYETFGPSKTSRIDDLGRPVDYIRYLHTRGGGQPILHNNTNLVIPEDAYPFIYELGSATQLFKDLMNDIVDEDLNKDWVAGLSIDKEYYGINISFPYAGILVNPVAPDGKTPLGATGSFYDTLIHELTHVFEEDHKERFIKVQSKLFGIAADNQVEIPVRKALEDSFTKHWNVFENLRNEFNDSRRTRNLKNELSESLRQFTPGYRQERDNSLGAENRRGSVPIGRLSEEGGRVQEGIRRGGTDELRGDGESSRVTPSTGRAALSRSNFKGDPREDNKIDPYDKNKPSLPPYKQPPTSRNPKDIIDAVTWGYVNIDQFGKKLGRDRGIRVIIPAGSRDLFGERHIRRHNEDIARNTPYADANEFLAGFFNQLANSPKDLSSGDISYHVDDWGKKLKFIWDSPSFSAPGVVVMEYRDDVNDYMVEPRYVVVTGFANEAYSQNTPDGSNATGPRQGIAATTTAVKDFYDNRPSVVPSSGRAALNRSAIRNPAEQAAIDAYMGPGGLKQDQKDKSFIKAVFKGMQQYDISFWEEFRYQIIDKYQGILSNERAASAKLRASGQLGLSPQEMAATSAHAFMMLKDRAGAFLESMLKYGTIGFTRIQGGDWMDGTVTVNDMQLDNTATNVLMHVPGEGIVRRDVSLPDLYSGTGGLLAILSRIHGKNNSLLNKFFAYGRAVRAYRLNVQEGKPVPDEFLGDAMNDALEFGYKHPEIAVAYANLQKWNESLVNFAVDANVLTREQADIWLRYADYVPFYLDTTGEMTAELREKFRRATKSEDDFKMLNSMLPKPPSKKYKGFKEGTLEDPIQATIRNSMALINESMKNIASHRFLRNMVTTGDARKLDDSKREDRAIKYQAVTVYENGRTVRYYVRDPYLHDIMVGSFDGQGPLESITKAFSFPARLLREGVTRMPDFLLANTTRDAILSWLVHGTTKDPFRATADSISRIVKDTLAKDGGGTPTQQRLAKAGVVGGLELKDVDLKGVEKRFSRKLAPSSSPSALLSRLWDNLGDVGNFSESAARQRVYERTYDREYKRFMNQGKEGGLTGEALTSYADTHATGQAAFQAMEVLNFSRRGNAPLLRFFTATIPFLNARIQGLDVFYRNARGENTLGIDPDAAKRGFMARSSMVVGATALYAMFMYGDDDFENESEYKRLDNWLIPLGPLANERNKFLYVPIPFEAGILFKTLPEELVRIAMGESTGEQYRAVQHAITGTLAMNPLPQAIRPAVETWTNYNFFTQQPIVPYFMGKLDQNEQYRDSTSATSRVLSSVIPDFIPFTSPLEIENLMKGYIGSSWNYLTMVTDLVLHRPEFGLNDKTETLLTDRPFFRRFISNGLGRGRAEDYYRMRDEVNGVVATINRLKVKDPSRVSDYARANLDALRARAFVREADKALKKIRSARNAILSSDLSPEDKRKRVDQLKRAEISVYRSMPASFGGKG